MTHSLDWSALLPGRRRFLRDSACGLGAIAFAWLNAEEGRGQSTGLPGFAELPVAGYAFGGRHNSLQDTELLILVTPRKLRLADHLTRTIFAGRGDTGGHATPTPGTLQSPAPPPQP